MSMTAGNPPDRPAAARNVFGMSIDPEKVFYITVKAREFDVKELAAGDNLASSATDDLEAEVLELNPDDATLEELAGAINGLNEEERLSLLAIFWIGRGDFLPDQWDEAVALAREEAGSSHVGRYLIGTPRLGDYLEEGMAALGQPTTEFSVGRL